MAKVHIHVGAHRTGSSAFQMFLDINAAALRAQGFDLAYPDRNGAEGGRLKLFLPAPRHTPDTVDWRVKKADGSLKFPLVAGPQVSYARPRRNLPRNIHVAAATPPRHPREASAR